MAVYEYCDHGDLKSFIDRHPEKARDASFLRSLVSGLLSALAHLHAAGTAHCDVKPENILLGKNFRPVLADFGMAQPINDTMVPQGTPSYLAPEVARAWASGITSTTFVANIDIFSLGVTAIHCLTGRYPFGRISAKLERKYRGTYSLAEMESWFELSFHWGSFQRAFPEQADFVFSCLARDPARRPSAEQLLATLRSR